MVKKSPKPYFTEGTPPELELDSTVPNLMFVEFLGRLEGAAKVDIDPRQELLVMQLRARCVKYAMSDQVDEMVTTINQLCAIYHGATIKGGAKSFDVFRAVLDEYVDIQEQLYLSWEQALQKEQRPTGRTNNLLTHCHDLIEGNLRKLATLGIYSLDVLEDRGRASTLTPQQYVDLTLKGKDTTYPR